MPTENITRAHLAARLIAECHADIAGLEAIKLPPHDPTIAIEELLLGYPPDDREDHWEAIKAYADIHARRAVQTNARQAGRAERQESAKLHVPEECPHMIFFDDADRQPLMFAGTGARQGALRAWDQVSIGWNAHLFVRVARNSRDDRYPSATVAAPQPAAQHHSGGVTELVEALEQIVQQYPNPDINHVDYRVHACRHAETALAAYRALPVAQQGAEVRRLREALEGMLEYFPEGASDGECFAVDAARAALSASTGQEVS